MDAIDCGWKNAKKIFPLNYLLETEKFKKGLQNENGKAKEQDDLEESEPDTI